ncbi:MAG TPA: TolC family protein [Candidatus Acidoferrales bacterium]|nr:TolC family protein [Candidatus Acidoferrales bacterium]HEV2341027.1 TolC family protein [Candidatus Acidoferrales bacterium]
MKAYSALLLASLLVTTTSFARAQQGLSASQPTNLADLLKEAADNNPQIQAARSAWQAQTKVPSQVSAPPDPVVSLQQFSVGSPRPFAGYTNSDFAYFGLGFSQDLPYPGKLRLRGKAAQSEADALKERWQDERRRASAQIKAIYFELAYEQEELAILDRDGGLLAQMEKIAEARYRTGQVSEQDVLKAQLEQTDLIRETAAEQQKVGQLEADLKALLNRLPNSPDIVASGLTETPFALTFAELASQIQTGDPAVLAESEEIKKQATEVQLAHKDFYPDFNLQYAWQRTDPTQVRAYYMLTFSATIPIYRHRRQEAELAEAKEMQAQSQHAYDAQVQQAYSELRNNYVQATTAERLLGIYKQGLIPQASASFNAGMAAYQTGREDFQTLLSAFLDELRLESEYWRSLAEHEIALARVEELTGAALN